MFLGIVTRAVIRVWLKGASPDSGSATFVKTFACCAMYTSGKPKGVRLSLWLLRLWLVLLVLPFLTLFALTLARRENWPRRSPAGRWAAFDLNAPSI
jgi:hypothetical protein